MKFAMIGQTGVAAFLLLMVLAGPAQACLPEMAEPMLSGESEAAYRTRVDALRSERAARWLRERQADALQRADLIFIARNTDWYPPYRPRMRNGRPVPPRPVSISYPAPTYYKPVAWFRGARITDLFQLRTDMTSCGPTGIGDTTLSEPGDRFLFFARKGPLTQDAIIDAIALDKINDPALIAFVARHRGVPRPKL